MKGTINRAMRWSPLVALLLMSCSSEPAGTPAIAPNDSQATLASSSPGPAPKPAPTSRAGPRGRREVKTKLSTAARGTVD